MAVVRLFCTLTLLVYTLLLQLVLIVLIVVVVVVVVVLEEWLYLHSTRLLVQRESRQSREKGRWSGWAWPNQLVTVPSSCYYGVQVGRSFGI